MTYNVFIRGIYSTALTKLFYDLGYNIVYSSPPIRERFNLEEFSENWKNKFSKQIIINDRYDREGISVTTKKEIWPDIKDTFPLNGSDFPNLLQYYARFPMNSIYKGIVISCNKIKNYSLVRLIPEQQNNDTEVESHFTTTIGRINRFLPVGSEDIFQISYEDVGQSYAYLNQGYTVSGDLAVIMPYNKRGLISKKIKDKTERTRLKKVIDEITAKDFGILIRTVAQYADELEILKQIQQLREKYIEIESLINQSGSQIGEIYSDAVSLNYLFPNTTKYKFDQIRDSILPTLPLHHEIKATTNVGDRSHLKTLLLIEEILEETGGNGFTESIQNKFLSYYSSNLYVPRQILNIHHYKINGRILHLQSGQIKKIDRLRNPNRLQVILRRHVKSQGLYDGLEIPIEEGDYAIGIYEQESWFSETSYYTKDNELKGKYFNINTPLVFRPDGIHYFDLEIDVIEPLNRKRIVIDAELLEKAAERGIISPYLYSKALETAEELKNNEKIINRTPHQGLKEEIG
ncbi:MAG: ribonuclease E/G [Candidatus Lokiarchaeota archaeon]|nr:ribonuclease E/G [Candidatus Lokiarchaeota archaeon]